MLIAFVKKKKKVLVNHPMRAKKKYMILKRVNVRRICN